MEKTLDVLIALHTGYNGDNPNKWVNPDIESLVAKHTTEVIDTNHNGHYLKMDFGVDGNYKNVLYLIVAVDEETYTSFDQWGDDVAQKLGKMAHINKYSHEYEYLTHDEYKDYSITPDVSISCYLGEYSWDT